ncbi:MAG: YkgJ family cysteine cluster protein [Desulfuromonadales bacterium]|nr:YkgJ family cysteine cluster protein [Desulfuromonadales bacterium]
MTTETTPSSDPEITCANCKACCCRQEAALFNDAHIPNDLTVVNAWGGRSMLRLEDGWCVALNRETLKCGIYKKRPWICREFVMGEDECLAARAANL